MALPSQPAESARPSTPARLLVVDDDPALRDAFTFLLAEEGYAVQVASSPDDALAQVDAQTFHLIITDLFAPAGREPLRSVEALRQHAFPTPVGVATGWPASAQEAERQGFCFVVNKPFDLDDLLARIAACLHQPLTPDQARQAEVVQRYFAALSARDWDGLARLCSEDVTYVLPGSTPFSTTIQGREAFRAYSEDTFKHFPAARFEDIGVFPTPNGLAARYQARWQMPDLGEQQQAGSVLFQFAGDHIQQIGVRLNDARLLALLG